MNFIRETVETVYENDTVNIKKKLNKVSNEITKYQEQAKHYIDENYVTFLPNLTSNEMYLVEGEKLIREVEDLVNNVEGETKQVLYSATDELRQYEDELEQISLGLNTTYKILKIDQYFQRLENSKPKEEYIEQMLILGKLKALIDNRNDKIFSKLDCYANIKIKYCIESEMFIRNMNKRFEQLVQLNEKTFQNTKSISIKVTKNETQLRDILIALFNTKHNPIILCEFLIENIFTPIIKKPVALSQLDLKDFYQLSLSYDIKKDVDEYYRPNYQTVFKNIVQVINFLDYINIELSETKCVLSAIGILLKDKLIRLLINECLLYSIPETIEDLNGSSLVDDVEEFNKFLIDSYVINEEIDTDLVNKVKNIRILFRDRFTKKILDKAEEISRKDLHDIIEAPHEKEVAGVKTLIFPRSMISRSVVELITHMDRVLKEANNSNIGPDISEQLSSTIPSIINQYIGDVPKYHQKFLIDIPQQTAIFYNNCSYLAHWLTISFEKDIDFFTTMVTSLETVAEDHLSKQIIQQKTQLLNILKEFDVSDLGSSEHSLQKVIRQCLRQLDLLKNVWHPVLPVNVYNKTMKTLLNVLCNEVVNRILSVEDISTTASHELVDIINIIETRAPEIFEDKRDIIQIKLWMKLIHLKMILDASLVQISEQWCSGKGPLALNFTPEEIKHLIRALFRNTERRATILSRIG